MDKNYLTWYKQIEIEITNRDDISLLLASSVSQPTDLLMADLKRFMEQIDQRIPYSNAIGHPLLKQAIADRYQVPWQNVVITNGVSNAIYLICRALLEKGDHVIVEEPVYQSLVLVPEFIGAEVSFTRRQAPDFYLDIDNIISLMKPSTQIILITNIHNPTGALTSDDNLRDLVNRAKQINPDIKIFVDEIYRDFVSGNLGCAYKLDDCFISLNSLTKVYGLGIIHQGWLIANKGIVEKINYLQNLVEGSGSRLLESFASLVVENLGAYRERSMKIIETNTEIMSQYGQDLVDKGFISGEMPQYGCTFFPRIDSMDSTEILVQQLIDKYKIYLVPGNFFYAPKHLRLGFGNDTNQLGDALNAFSDALTDLL